MNRSPQVTRPTGRPSSSTSRDDRQRGIGLDLVDEQAIISRADRGEPVSAAGEDDAIDSLLAGRGAIGLAQFPRAGGRLERLARLPVDPDPGQGKQADQRTSAGQEHGRDLAAGLRLALRGGCARRPKETRLSVPAQMRARLVRCRTNSKISTAIENTVMAM